LKRKILIVLFTALMVFSIAVPALATHSQGLLFGKTTTLDAGGGTTYTPTDSASNLTDGDHTTTVSFNNSESYRFELDAISDLNKYYIEITSSSSPFVINFNDSNNNVIYQKSFASGTVGVFEEAIDVLNVKYITVGGVSGTSVTISELDVYENSDITAPATPTGLTSTSLDGQVDLSWDANTETDLAGYNVYQSTDNVTFTKVNTSLITTTSYSVTGLTNGTTYYFTVSAVDTSGNESAQSTSVSATPSASTTTDTTPPGEVTGLSETHTDTEVTLSWTNPTDSDFSKVKLYKDGAFVAEGSLTSYIFSGLMPSTSYTFEVTTVDSSGNESLGSSISVTTSQSTDTTAPEPPTNVTVNAGNKALYVQFDRSVSEDVYGYNVYVDGTKYNTSPFTSNYYQVTGLNNDQTYSIQVSAQDTSGNESSLTLGVSGTPSLDAVPLVRLDFDLKDVGNGVTSWFTSIWLILAFAVAIPLSFVIAGRIKGLFST
jgi:hypothetical protein